MFGHGDIWNAIDLLAEANGLSASGLARRAGLDPTAFNKSKRTAGGRPRWPSSESIAKILNTTGTTLGEFAGYVDTRAGPAWTIRVVVWDEAARAGLFDEAGLPTGGAWRDLRFPAINGGDAFGIEVTTDDMWPIYQAGDLLIISPQAELHDGDRVFVRTRFGEIMVRRLERHAGTVVELTALSPAAPVRELSVRDIEAMHRIVWASQ